MRLVIIIVCPGTFYALITDFISSSRYLYHFSKRRAALALRQPAEPDSLIKQAGSIAAAQYVVNRGLVVPLRSSIYRGILEGTETAASGAVLADVYIREAQGFRAEYSAFKGGACH